MIEFWFEFASTYSYPAAMRVEQVAKAHGVEVQWRPFLLGPIFKTQGWNDSPFNLYEAKGRYMWRDLERLCLADGLQFQRPSQFPRNGLLAARVTCEFQHESWVPEFVRTVYHANFARDLDISDPQIVADCLTAVGQNPDQVIAQAQSPDGKSKLTDQTQDAIEHGIFGAPMFVVGGELFWGNDRLEQAMAFAANVRLAR